MTGERDELLENLPTGDSRRGDQKKSTKNKSGGVLDRCKRRSLVSVE